VGAKAGKWHYHQVVDARRCSDHTRSAAWVVDLTLFDDMEHSHYQLVIEGCMAPQRGHAV
jgi:hypothetical protein